jgi:hypothetical protein
MDHEGYEGTGGSSPLPICGYHHSHSVRKTQLSNDPTLSSLPLLSTFLKYYARPYLGIFAPVAKQVPGSLEPGTAANTQRKEGDNVNDPALLNEGEELVEQEIRDRFKRMCEGYFESVCKKLVLEHKVSLLVEVLPALRVADIMSPMMRIYSALTRARSSES